MTNNNKAKRIKREKYYSEEQEEIFKFIKILIIIVLLILAIYFFTRIFVSKDLFNKSDKEPDIVTGAINYDTTIIGSILNKPENEYYVMLYDASLPNAVYYNGLISSYQRNTKALRVYVADLSNEFNKKYVSSDNNLNVSNLDDFKVSNIALIKISDGKIVESYTNDDKISEQLAYNKDTEK